ncbi:STAS domain-containing protein [Chitinimonas koreensis]|uniref:STAS domain-containing protein n=1 Tax=Chitinimonas koreensis TaxID=356302 RepID=UPI000409EC97|nr:STAS domain-containing protein [Chitinimonas koreensis]QNM97033.1 STAS domain-containing protein [Chitinimonas koreensis]
MVFSFFKKKDVEPDEPLPKQPRIVQPKPATPPAGDGGPAAEAAAPPRELPVLDFTTIGPTTISGARIDVVESSDALSAAMEQAAISFANDQVDDAIAILVADIATAEGQHALDTWLMLFDLYQMRNRRAEFDELALRFVVAFERSAPVWQGASGADKPAVPPAQAKAGGPSYLFPQQLKGDTVEGQLDQLEKLTAAGAPVRIDFGRIEQIDSAAAAAVVARWARFRKKKVRFQPTGGPALADKLKASIEVMRRVDDEAPFWLLLMEVYQLLGLQEDFENTAVDYAVTYEVSPPSWDITAKTKTAAEVAAEEAKLRAEAPTPEPVVDAFQFQGPIVGGSEAAFAPMLAYAEEHQDVRIDFSRVSRIDFVSAGMLMNALVTLTAQGKSPILTGANELVVALFRIMGIADVARIVRKK